MSKKITIMFIFLLMITGCSFGGEEKKTPIPPVEPPKTYETIAFTLKGARYVLPVKYQELLSAGWVAQANIDYNIEPNTIIANQYLRNGDNVIKVTFYNPDTLQAHRMEDVFIGAIEAENRTFGSDVAVDISVHDGIVFTTPIETVTKMLGAPQKSENDVFNIYTYNHTNVAKTTISYHKDGQDGNASRWIAIQNYRALK